VYAALQIPVGAMLDRFRSVRLLTGGALLMAGGQALLAFATGVPGAITARVLVGAGDAMTFISVLRLVSGWFPAARIPVLNQLTGLVGQLGQVLSAVPLVALLDGPGWLTAFLAAAATSVLVTILAVVVIHDSPEHRVLAGEVATMRRLARDLVDAWLHPGTRLGLWTHFTTQFSGMVFALMWGFPFLVAGENIARGTASALLTLYVLVGVATAPAVGVYAQRQPLRRSWLVLGIVVATVLVWSVVIGWPGRAPLPLVVLLVVVLGTGGPGAMLGFEFARTFNPPNRLGTATGIVNVGGFVATLMTILLVGVVLDLRTGGRATYSLTDFKYAMSVQYLVWLLGSAGVLRTRQLARRRLEEQGVDVPRMRDALIGRLRRRR
jgi:MFS family permease